MIIAQSIQRRVCAALLLLVVVFASEGWAKVDLMPAEDAERISVLLPEAELLDGGVRFLQHQAGTGPRIQRGDYVTALYVGRLLNGRVFNQKRSRDHTYRFRVGAHPREVILGWDLALRHMQAGGRYTIAIPAKLAYGERGRAGQVPPNATLLFEIEILAVNR